MARYTPIRAVIVLAAVAYMGSAAVGSSIPGKRVVVEKLEVQWSKPIPLEPDLHPVKTPKGGIARVYMGLRVNTYLCTVAYMRNGQRHEGWTAHIFCMTVRSLDPKAPYEWSVWTRLPVSNCRVLTDKQDSNYLAWTSGRLIQFAEMSSPNKARAQLDAYVSFRYRNHRDLGVRMIGLRSFVPDSKWGGDMFNPDISTRSIEKDAQGRLVVQVCGPKGRPVYTFVLGPRGWELKR